jgi:hypothetical protein
MFGSRHLDSLYALNIGFVKSRERYYPQHHEDDRYEERSPCSQRLYTNKGVIRESKSNSCTK